MNSWAWQVHSAVLEGLRAEREAKKRGRMEKETKEEPWLGVLAGNVRVHPEGLVTGGECREDDDGDDDDDHDDDDVRFCCCTILSWLHQGRSSVRPQGFHFRGM
jgi:hypothetical protein